MSRTVQMLVEEAVNIYHASKVGFVEPDVEESYAKSWRIWQWSQKLSSLFDMALWDVNHPCADKYVAKKGRVVVKWIGKCGWSPNAIHDELDFHKQLTERGLKRFLPKLYAHFNDEFLIEQMCHKRSWDLWGQDMDILRCEIANAGLRMYDLGSRNVMHFMGKPKLIDGSLTNH